MTEAKARAVFELAGIGVEKLYKAQNPYWANERAMQQNWPMWLCLTAYGIITMHWRKRVISIDWSETEVRCIVTEDDVTKNETSVHAWSYSKAVEYLTALRRSQEIKGCGPQASSSVATAGFVEEMTVREAWRILEEYVPIFGDERCISAHKLLLLAAEVQEMRQTQETWPSSDLPYMTAAQIRAEMAARRKIAAMSSIST